MTEPSPRPIGARKIEPADEPEPAEPPVSDTTNEPDPTPVRPVRPEPVSDFEKTDEPATQPTEPTAETTPDKIESSADTSTRSDDTDRPGTIDRSPSCVAQDTDGTSNADCQTKQLSIIAQPSDSSGESQQAATADGGNGETISELAASPDSNVTESPRAAAESPPRSEQQNADDSTDQWSNVGLPQSLLADALTDALEDEHGAAADSELGQTVFAAGAFAVAFSKPLSRLTGSGSSPFSDPSAPSAIPVAFTRRRRKDDRKSASNTKDRPDDTDDPDDSPHTPRGRGPARLTTAAFDGAERPDAREQYGSIEAAIQATLQSRRESSEDSPHTSGVFQSAKSFAAAAIVAAAALLTLQGKRRPERSRPELRPAAPTYHGQTAVAAS